MSQTPTEPTHAFGCIICSDAFNVNVQRKICTLPQCGHVYHEYCLKRWLRTQIRQAIPSSCPKCRTPATENQIIRLFLHQTISDGNDATEAVDEGEDVNLINDDLDFLENGVNRILGELHDIRFRLTVPMPTQTTTNDDTSNDMDLQQDQTLSDANDDNAALTVAPWDQWVAPPYRSSYAHINSLTALDQHLRSLGSDITAMADVVTGLEAFVQTLP